MTPAAPTPRELKYLSDIDNQSSMRFYATIVQFFRSQPANHNQRPHRDPVAAIRSALAEALVYYYPVAGRLRELPPDGRLVVECTAEGVVFVEADADVSLAQLGEPLLPPYPCVEELLCDLGDSGVVVGNPLAFFQVCVLFHRDSFFYRLMALCYRFITYLLIRNVSLLKPSLLMNFSIFSRKS